MKKRFHQLDGYKWNQERLKVHQDKANIPKNKGRIMFPSAHDITPPFIEENITFMHQILNAGNKLLIVSKPHEFCIQRLCGEFKTKKDRIIFRFTIGSIENQVLKFWEPGAPLFEERLLCLKLAHEQGYQTSVSIEPMLEGNIDLLIKELEPYVTGTIWLGKINRLKSNLTLNGYATPEIMKRAEELQTNQNDLTIWALYDKHKDNSKIRFKDSIKRVVGIQFQSEPGLDM